MRIRWSDLRLYSTACNLCSEYPSSSKILRMRETLVNHSTRYLSGRDNRVRPVLFTVRVLDLRVTVLALFGSVRPVDWTSRIGLLSR